MRYFRLLWRLHSTCFNEKTAKCIVYDERGQIYDVSIKQNCYKTVKLASTPISSLASMLNRTNQVITAYENGDVLVLDTDSAISINLSAQCPAMAKSVIRIIRAHPIENVVIMASDDKSISMWDLR